MAYNYFSQPGFLGYQPYQQYQPQINNYQQSQNSSGFINVRSEEEARNYPISPNSSLTFINECEPYFYVKTAGANQFDRPKFEKYILTKVDETENKATKEDTPEYALKSDISDLWAEIEKLKGAVSNEQPIIQGQPGTTAETAATSGH